MVSVQIQILVYMKKRSAYLIAGALVLLFVVGLAVLIGTRHEGGSSASRAAEGAGNGSSSGGSGGFLSGVADDAAPAQSSARRSAPRASRFARPLLRNGKPLPAAVGDLPVAKVAIGKRVVTPSFGRDRISERMHVHAEKDISVRLRLPDSVPGDPVVIQMLDGGTLRENADRIQQTVVDDRGELDFDLTLTDEGGIYRVFVKQTTGDTVLEFWGGDPLTRRDLSGLTNVNHDF